VVVVNARFDASSPSAAGGNGGWPRELWSYECAFGLAPFRVQANKDDPSSPMGANNNNPLDSPAPDDPNRFRPSVVLLKRHGRPWHLFVDDGLGAKGPGGRANPNYNFCGSIDGAGAGIGGIGGGGPRRPPLQAVIPAVVEFLSRVSAQNAARAASSDSLAARMAAAEEATERAVGGGGEARDGDSEGQEASIEYLNRIFSLEMSTGGEEDTGKEEEKKKGGFFGIGGGGSQDGGSADGDDDEPPVLGSTENVEFLNRLFNMEDAGGEEEAE
jgi:hypothetical protein